MTYITVREMEQRLHKMGPSLFNPRYTVDRIHNESGEPSWQMGIFKAKRTDHPTMSTIVGTGNSLLKSVLIDEQAVFHLEAAEDVLGQKIK